MSDFNNESDRFIDLYRDGETVRKFVMEQNIHHNYNIAASRGDKELTERIEKNWQNIYGYPYFQSKPMPVGVYGGPGQGKTSVLREAAKDAAHFMGLNFVSDRNVVPGKNDFFFDSVTLGGKLSPNSVKGTELPDKQAFIDADGNAIEERVMENILPTNVTKAKYARAAFILLDDAPNAHPDVLTAIYDLLKPEVGSDFSNVYYSYSGNTGEDGAAAKKFNTAIASRARVIYMKDKPLDFIKRIDNEYRNDIAYSYINSIYLSFIEQNGALLNTSPLVAQQEKTLFACSRTWTQLIDQSVQVLRPAAYKNAHMPGMVGESEIAMMLRDLSELATDNLGRDVAKKLQQHTLRVIQDAEPIAKAILATGKIDPSIEARIATKYVDGTAAPEIEFSYSLAVSLANSAAEQYTYAHKANDHAKCMSILDAFTTGMFEAIKGPQASEFAGHCAQTFFNGLVARNPNDNNIGVRTKEGVTIISNSLFSNTVSAAAKSRYAMAKIRTPLGEIQLIDRLRDNAAIKGANTDEIANKIGAEDILKKAIAANANAIATGNAKTVPAAPSKNANGAGANVTQQNTAAPGSVQVPQANPAQGRANSGSMPVDDSTNASNPPPLAQPDPNAQTTIKGTRPRIPGM